jgi:hypothetical protein
MNASDFGIDLGTLPALKLDEDAGRKVLTRMNSVPSFRDNLYESKLTFFCHYLEDHLNIDIGDALKNKDKAIALVPKHETVWNSISRVMDRHVFLIVTALCSFDVNTLDSDDLDMVGCVAYGGMFRDIPLAAMEADEISITLARRFKMDSDPMVQLVHSAQAVDLMKSQAGDYLQFMKAYVADAMRQGDNYAKGVKLGH